MAYRIVLSCMIVVVGFGCFAENATVSVAELKTPEKARAAFEKAEDAFEKHNLGEANRQLDKALSIFPQYTQALSLRGVIDLTQYKPEQARDSLEQAYRYDPNDGLTCIALGSAYNALGRFDDALRVLDRGLSLAPNNWQAHFEASKALLGKKEYEASLREVNKAGQLAPTNFASALHLVRAHALLGVKNYASAVTELEQYLGEEPNGASAQEARQTLDQVRAASGP